MIKLIYDECNPTRDRRPTTEEDVENDIHVEEFNSVKDLMEELAYLAGYDSLDEFLYEANMDANDSDAVISELLSYFTDPGDGSANIFYLNVDGKEFDDVMPYDSVAALDLSKATKEDVVNAILGESLNESTENGYEINYSCWIDEEGNFGLEGDFDTEEEAIAYCKDNNYYSVEKQYFDGNERVKTEEIFINPDYVDSDEIADAYMDNDEYYDEEAKNEDPWYKGSDDEDYDIELEDDSDLELDEKYSDNYKNARYEKLIGKKIRIIDIDDPYDAKDYNGREGIVEYVATNSFGDVYLDGTWGSLSIYPKVDTFEYVNETNECINNSIEEGLFDSEKEPVNYGHKAWVLNKIISSMNNEGAYYETGWLYIWPDGETEEECDDDFGDYDSFKELEDEFISIYKYNYDQEGDDYNFHEGGLYNPTREAVELAHEYDKKLGLEPIAVLGNVKECVDDVRFAESVETDNLETFDDKMDFLAGDEEEAIDGYDEIIPEVEDEHIKDQLTHIRDEEKAHKKYLNDVKEDPSIDYEDPEELEEGINEDINNYELNYEDCDFGRTDGEYYFSTNISQNDNEDDNLQITIDCETDKDDINCYYDEIEKFQGYSYGENVVELDPNDVRTGVIYSTWDDFSKKFTKDEVVNVYGISAEDLEALTKKATDEAVDKFIDDVIEYYSENMDELIPEDDGPDPDYEYERYRDMRDE